ncbi:EscU/YscU/HrcU family type III secretion system export apparatus switch protein [Parathalassolituus penaei]|uniref:Flagellar biosynthetic protein FlhB n=1 Tax=Parathalassolituus penaei TaxID=2997323 RepID=A0A9X3IQ37_9GAMM|nr:EscU/YscU/HrcU family type III secretion system export apparatus switch protein [Parathalassolituus penaei]MCY0963757.1 EscU/YscU/HrcU family type III secretion system export apparatus switch protein [Parathalassolituus penaei]
MATQDKKPGIPESLLNSTAAVALGYQPDKHDAPHLIAHGEDALAQAIISLALAHNIPIYENAELTRWLGQLQQDEEIPEALYRVIAEILAVGLSLRTQTPPG